MFETLIRIIRIYIRIEVGINSLSLDKIDTFISSTVLGIQNSQYSWHCKHWLLYMDKD